MGVILKGLYCPACYVGQQYHEPVAEGGNAVEMAAPSLEEMK